MALPLQPLGDICHVPGAGVTQKLSISGIYSVKMCHVKMVHMVC